MSKNTQISELINYLSVDGSGNIVITGSLIGPAGATYATQSYVSTNYLGLSGGTLTGNIVITQTSSEPLRIERIIGSTIYGKYSLAISGGGAFSIYDAIADTDRLIISSTGATTFSSYLTANGYYVPNTAEQGFATLNGSNGMLLNGTSGYVVLMSGGNETIYLSNTGKVGIGTTSPSVLLQLAINGGFPVLGTNHTSSNLFLSSANRLWGMYFGLDGNSGTGWIQQMRNDGATAYPIILQPVGGNVGIGTTSPGAKLDVAGRVQGLNFFSVGSLNSADGSFFIDHPGIQTWKIGINNTNTSTFSIGNDNGGAYATKILNITNAGFVGVGTISPSHRLQVSGNIYSTDTVFGRNIKPEAFASVSAGSPSGATIPYGYSMLSISTPCDNNWRAILTNINDTKAYFWASIGDAASKDTANYFMSMTSPGYGVYNFGTISYQDNGWNTGSFEFSYDNSGNGTHRLLVRCSSYYNSGNTAYGNIYFLRIE